MPIIEFNADIGEGGPDDDALLAAVAAANVCCGAHAGDPDTTRTALEHCRDRGVRVNAHPGYPDRPNFGRVELHYTPKQIHTLILHQTGGLLALARGVGVSVDAIKPHGALYHRAASDPDAAKAVAAAAFLLGLGVVGLPGTAIEAAAAKVGVPFTPEGFADRRYTEAGTLVPRTEPDAVINDPAEAAAQVLRLAASGVQSFCVHGDRPNAAAFLYAVRAKLP